APRELELRAQQVARSERQAVAQARPIEPRLALALDIAPRHEAGIQTEVVVLGLADGAQVAKAAVAAAETLGHQERPLQAAVRQRRRRPQFGILLLQFPVARVIALPAESRAPAAVRSPLHPPQELEAGLLALGLGRVRGLARLLEV